MASDAAACAARVIACVVWLPPDTQVHGRCCEVSPQAMTTSSHGMPSISAAGRWTSNTDSVPRLPTPDCTYSLPSGLIINSPSKPTEPATNVLTATPTPRTVDPVRLPDRARRSSQPNSSAPRSSASFTKALVA